MESDVEIALVALQVFADDGTMDLDELDHLLDLAMRDGVIDSDEKRVLKNLFDRCPEGSVPEEVQQRIQEIRGKHGI